jgi:capsule biosynthesis phosphatase
MIVIIPLGGTGERFKKNNYKKPKALINLAGKPVLYYLLENLNLENIDFVSIPYNKEYYNFNFEEQVTKDFPKIIFKFYKLMNNTEGAAETINLALNTFDCEDKPILCLDCDNFYTTDIVTLWDGKNKVITFEDLNNDPIYSYIGFSKNVVNNIAEKEKISNLACTGAYGFESYIQLLEYTQRILDNKIKQKNEYYTSTVIREMINDGIEFHYSVINTNVYHCLGTPIQLKLFYSNFKNIANLNVKHLRICFDFDNTLVTFPKLKDDYSWVEPIYKNIQLLKYLKRLGHTIIIHTARRMNTHKGNLGKVLCDIGKVTFDTLEKFDIPFDEIYFGKPLADFYIDDLAINCFDNMEKEMGFYMDTIEPRDFNRLEENTIITITKKSKDLSGEINYYKNIPSSLKHYFPLLIDNGEDNTWFRAEKINGLALSNIYLSELLKEETLIHVMDTINLIHNTPFINEEDINIYENYSNKLKERYEKYDYSKYNNSEKIYSSLIKDLTLYENENRGKTTIIHGDPVFTNIIINSYGKIKFIDMRGKIGSKKTILGDKNYDWAKLYQSLIGYDSILLDRTINEDYSNKMKTVFEMYFLKLYNIEELENVKMITKSLLFSLLPLHDNDKCYKYYELINF